MSFTPNDRDGNVAGSRPRLSDLALQVHTTAILASLGSDDAGLISGELLDSIPVDTTTAAVELELTGLWQREADGYRVDPAEQRALLRIIDDQLVSLADDCTRKGGHLVMPDQPGYCARCLSAL